MGNTTVNGNGEDRGIMAGLFVILFIAGLMTGVAWALYAVFGAWGLVFGVMTLIIMGMVK